MDAGTKVAYFYTRRANEAAQNRSKTHGYRSEAGKCVKRCCVLIDTSDQEEKKQLREEEHQLREEEHQLREKKHQLREEENLLLKLQLRSESTLLLNIHVA